MPGPAQCADGLDNDLDGRADAADLGCASANDNDETDPPVSLGSSIGGPSLLTPFPVVRLRGRILESGVRVTLLSVTAPYDAKITIRCRGPLGSCPRATYTRVAARPTTRIRAFERRMRAGTVLRVFVTRNGFVGKYTRFTIRRRGAPARTDACAQPNVTAFRCP